MFMNTSTGGKAEKLAELAVIAKKIPGKVKICRDNAKLYSYFVTLKFLLKREI